MTDLRTPEESRHTTEGGRAKAETLSTSIWVPRFWVESTRLALVTHTPLHIFLKNKTKNPSAIYMYR